MGLFDPSWLKLHHRVCDQYEHYATQAFIKNPKEEVRVFLIVGKILQHELWLSEQDALEKSLDLDILFLDFQVKPEIEKAALKIDPNASSELIEGIFQTVKKTFHDSGQHNLFFLYFVISYLLTKKNYGITRGDYFIKVWKNLIPEDKGFFKTLKRALRIATITAVEEKQIKK